MRSSSRLAGARESRRRYFFERSNVHAETARRSSTSRQKPRLAERTLRDSAWARLYTAMKAAEKFRQAIEIELQAGFKKAGKNAGRVVLTAIEGKAEADEGIIVGQTEPL